MTTTTTTTTTTDEATAATQRLQKFRQRTLLTATSTALVLVANSFTLPYRQVRRTEELECSNSHCLGTLAAARSAVTLVGATVMGKLVDHTGKPAGLWVGCVCAALALLMEYRATSLFGLRLSILPSLGQQNLTLAKAMIAQLQLNEGSSLSAGERSWSTGMLGMSIGLAMMTGPYLGVSLLKNYEYALAASLMAILLAAVLIGCIQPLQKPNNEKLLQQTATTNKSSSFWAVLDIPSVRSPAGRCLLLYKLLSGLSFHMYQTIWAANMRETLRFGPAAYGRYFSIVGFFFAISQGVVAPMCTRRFAGTSRGRVRLLSVVFFVIGCARYWAFQTANVVLIYCLFSSIVLAYGIASTTVSTDATRVAGPDDLGSFFGLLSTVDGGAGMVGPLLSAALYKIHAQAPLAVVLLFNAAIFSMFSFGVYERTIRGKTKIA